MSSYKALIFDLGNVVFKCSFEPTSRYWAQLSKQEAGKIRNIIENSTWHHDFEKSMISEDEFRKKISAEINYELTAREFVKGWNAIYGDVVNGMDELLVTLKDQYKIIALTNTNTTHSGVWKKKYESTLVNFESVFSSHEIYSRKPGRGAYRICLDYLSLPAEEVIFLDDRLENVEAAEKMGISGIHVTSFNQMTAELTKKGVIKPV